MTPNSTPRPIVPSNQLRSLAHLGGFTIVVPLTNPQTELPVQGRKRRRARRTNGRQLAIAGQ